MREQGLSNATSWPVWNIARAGGSRRTRARGLVVLAMFLVWPVWAAVRAVQLHTGPVRVAVVVVTVVYGASWIVAMAYGISRPPRERVLLLGWLFALGAGLAVLLADPADLG